MPNSNLQTRLRGAQLLMGSTTPRSNGSDHASNLEHAPESPSTPKKDPETPAALGAKVRNGLLCIAALAILLAVIWAKDFGQVLQVMEVALLGGGLLSFVVLIRQTTAAAEQAKAAADQAEQSANQARAAVDSNVALREWNSRLSYHEHFGELADGPKGELVKELVRDLGIGTNLDAMRPLDAHQVEAILQDEKHVRVLQWYLDEFEEFCVAVHVGVVHPQYAFELEGTRTVRAWHVFEPFVVERRNGNPFSQCYKYLEIIGKEWKERREQQMSMPVDEQELLQQQHDQLQRDKDRHRLEAERLRQDEETLAQRKSAIKPRQLGPVLDRTLNGGSSKAAPDNNGR